MSQMTVGLLLLILLSVLTIGMLLTLVLVRYVDRRRALAKKGTGGPDGEAGVRSVTYQPLFDSPSRWIAIRSGNPVAAQTVLGLHNAKPCSWGEGLNMLTDHTLFISPPIDGWLLVVGHGLPDPSDDVDECYRFILRLSRELGHVQFFSINRAVDHHAWVKAEGNRVIRAYAWAGETLWNQGRMTSAEAEVGMKCYGYGEARDPALIGGEVQHSNADKVTFLAARWSFDPTNIDEQRISAAQGIAGNLIHFKQH